MSDFTLFGSYEKMFDEVKNIDEKLDSLTDGKAAGKRQKIDEMINATKDAHEGVVNDFVKQLENVDIEVLIGIYFGVTRGLDKNFREKVNAGLEEIVSKLPDASPLISIDEVPAYQKARSVLYQQIKALIEVAGSVGDPHSDKMVMPKKRTGSKGKRGKRALSFFTWFIEDAEYSKLAQIVELYPQSWTKVAELTAAMREAKIDTKTPGDKIEFTLPDGKTLVGLNANVSDDEASDDEDDDDEEETSEEE